MSTVKTKDGVEIFYKDWGQDILRDTDASVASIAATLGYSSQTAFAAAFRKLTGEAPSDWRRRACQQQSLYKHVNRSGAEPTPGLLEVVKLKTNLTHVGDNGLEQIRRRIMILGMSLATFTMVHVIISLIAIVAGLVVMFGMLGSKRMPGLTVIFLAFTILTSVSGFLFPPLLFEKLSPGQVIGILSLVLLAIACFALYGMKLAGAWRWIYALTATVSLYLNVFVLAIQSFLKVPGLHALAPSVPPTEPPFAIVQGIVLVFFVVVIIGVIRRYRPMSEYA